VVKHLPSKCEVLNLIPRMDNKMKKEKEKKEEGGR
jgi:hypothetical protein